MKRFQLLILAKFWRKKQNKTLQMQIYRSICSTTQTVSTVFILLFVNNNSFLPFVLSVTTIDDKSTASTANSFVGAGKSAGIVSRLLHPIHCVPPRQDAVGKLTPCRLSPGRQPHQSLQLKQSNAKCGGNRLLIISNFPQLTHSPLSHYLHIFQDHIGNSQTGGYYPNNNDYLTGGGGVGDGHDFSNLQGLRSRSF